MKKSFLFFLINILFGHSVIGQSMNDYSADAMFNEGNIAYEAEKYGEAIYLYERAHMLEPYAGDIKINLQLAKEKLDTDIVELEPFFLASWWKSLYTLFLPGSWKLISVLVMIGCVFIFYIFLAKRSINKRTFYVSISLASFLFLVTILSGNARFNQIFNNYYAIATNGARTLHQGPDVVSEKVKDVVGGVKMKIIDQSGDWYKVATMDSEQGWIKKDKVRMLKYVID